MVLTLSTLGRAQSRAERDLRSRCARGCDGGWRSPDSTLRGAGCVARRLRRCRLGWTRGGNCDGYCFQTCALGAEVDTRNRNSSGFAGHYSSDCNTFFNRLVKSAVAVYHVSLAIGAMKLNHILVGLLLLPLGVSTFWSGQSLEQSWGLRLAGLNAITLLCLPVLLVAIMPVESLDAPLFRLAILVVIAACVVQILALVGAWKRRQNEA